MVCPTKTNEGAERLLDYCARKPDAEFEKHLESCAECRVVVAAQSDLWETLDRWLPPDVSPEFDTRLYARIAVDKRPSLWSRWWPAVALATACAVMAVGLFVRMPEATDTGKQARSEKIDIEQVEQTLDDLEILSPAS